jgi:hypothetical protein
MPAGWVSAAVWGLAGFASACALAGLEPNLVEEGLVLHVAQRLAAGQHLYSDIVFFTPPLPFELLGLLFRIFGEEIAVGRMAAALFQGAATAATWALARRLGAGRLPAAAAAMAMAAAPAFLFPLLSMFYYTPLAMCLGALVAWAALRGTEQPGWAFAAGLGVAGVALCKQTLGLSYALALLAALAFAAPAGRRLRAAGGLVLGGLAVTLLTLAFYGLRGDLDDLWRCLVTAPLELSESYRAPLINLWPPGQLGSEYFPSRPVYFSNLYFLRYGLYTDPGPVAVLATQLLYALPLLCLAASVVLQALGAVPRSLAIHTAFLFAMTTNLFPRSDWGHLAPALPPAGAHLMLLLALARPAALRRPRAVVAAATLVGLAGGALFLGHWVHAVSGPPTWGPRVPLRPVSAVYRVPSVPRVIHFLRERVEPGEPIFVARAEPLIYFATDTTNPTPFTGVLTTLHEEQEEAILAALPHVRYVVMSDTDQPLWTYYSDELPRVWKYLERHFHVAPFFPLDDASFIVVLERGEDRGPTLVDLVDERPGARAWVRESRDGELVDAPPAPRLVARHNHRPLPMRVGSWGGGIDYDLVVPEGARFEAGIGFRGMVSEDGFYGHPTRSHMVVSIGRDGSFETLIDARVDDSKHGGRTWTEVEADLARWAGQRVTLRLELVPERALRPDEELTWWGSPRIAGRATGSQPADPRGATAPYSPS